MAFKDVLTLEASVLGALAWADGVCDEREAAMFLDFVESTPLPDAERRELMAWIAAPPERASVLACFRGAPRPLALAILRHAYTLAHVDRDFHPAERTLIESLAAACGINAARADTLWRFLELSHQVAVLERELAGEA